LIARGLNLPPAERERFAHLLLESVADGDGYTEDELHAELDRRWGEYERGEVQAYTLDEMMAALRNQAERRKS
jgi:putative addiction module component (TIGR02574 family)